MQTDLWEQCAYCGRPLRLVAGFCAECHAPFAVAQRARLVADVRQRAGLDRHTRPVPAPIMHITAPGPVPGLPRPSPVFTRTLLGCSLVSLCLVVVFISMRVNANPLHLFFPPPDGSLIVSQTPQGDATTRLTVGKPFYLRYAVTISSDWAEVSLTIAPQHATEQTLVERWAQGQGQRVQTMVALSPDLWRFTLRKDGKVLQTVDIIIGTAT